jgi:hydrogenase maturation protease
VMVIGVGNAWRGDDAAGLLVARRLRGAVEAREHEGDCTGLVEAWTGAGHVVVVDAAASGAPPGTVRRFDALLAPLPARSLRSSTHAFGVADAVELARALGRLPARLEVCAIEGADFAAGAALTPEVAAAVDELASALAAAALSHGAEARSAQS